MRPLARYPVVAIISCLSLFVTFLFLLLVSLSLPIIKTIYLVQFRSTAPSPTPLSIATELRFGVWGVCASGYVYMCCQNAKVIFNICIVISDLNPPTWHSNPGLCYGPRLGYDIPDYIIDIAGVPRQVVEVVQHALLAVLVLHPIATGFATVSFLTSVFLASHAFSILSLILAIITALLTSIVFAIDVSLVAIAEDKVDDLPNFHFDVMFGNGVWMILVAVAFSWAAVITLSARACYCLGVRQYVPRSVAPPRHLTLLSHSEGIQMIKVAS